MVQEDRKILNTVWCHKHKWMFVCYGLIDYCVMHWKERRWVKERGRRMIPLIDNLLEKKNYRDLKKAAEDMSDWRTVRRDCHKRP